MTMFLGPNYLISFIHRLVLCDMISVVCVLSFVAYPSIFKHQNGKMEKIIWECKARVELSVSVHGTTWASLFAARIDWKHTNGDQSTQIVHRNLVPKDDKRKVFPPTHSSTHFTHLHLV
jgi:hypothetical protein